MQPAGKEARVWSSVQQAKLAQQQQAKSCSGRCKSGTRQANDQCGGKKADIKEILKGTICHDDHLYWILLSFFTIIA